jgi:hypothetical protein
MTDPPSSYPKTVLFLVFRAKKGKQRDELLLVRKSASDQWTVPLAILRQDPSTVCVEFMLAEFLQSSSVTDLSPVDPRHWAMASDVFGRFGFFECRVGEGVLAKSGQLAWFTNGHVNAAANIAEDTLAALGLEYVQSRLG